MDVSYFAVCEKLAVGYQGSSFVVEQIFITLRRNFVSDESFFIISIVL